MCKAVSWRTLHVVSHAAGRIERLDAVNPRAFVLSPLTLDRSLTPLRRLRGAGRELPAGRQCRSPGLRQAVGVSGRREPQPSRHVFDGAAAAAELRAAADAADRSQSAGG